MNIKDLEKLNSLKEKGVLTQEEFNKQKEIILSQGKTESTGTEMSMWNYFGLCLTKKYACFKGRANRKEYWSFFIIAAALIWLFSSAIYFMENQTEFVFLIPLYSLVFLLPWISVLVRRMHDVNISARWLFGTLFLPMFLLTILAAAGAVAEYTGDGTTSGSPIKTLLFVVGGFSLLGGSIAFLLITPLIPGSKKENKYGLLKENGKYNKIFPLILVCVSVFAFLLTFIIAFINGFNRATEKYENIQQPNVSDNTSLTGKTNKDIFVNVNSPAFQELLEEGISEYFVYYLSDGKNSPYTGNVYDYIVEQPIPLPEQDVVFTENGVIFVYSKGEIAANYLDRIRFFIPYNQLKPFLVFLQ